MFNSYRLHASFGRLIDRLAPTKADAIIGAIGGTCCGLLFLVPVTEKMPVNTEVRAELQAQASDLAVARTYLESLYPAVRSPDEYFHIQSAEYDRQTYQAPISLGAAQRLEEFNAGFQRRQSDPLIGDTLQQVEEADSQAEAAGTLALAASQLEDDEAAVRSELADLAENKTVENDLRDDRNRAFAGVAAFTVAALGLARTVWPERLKSYAKRYALRREARRGLKNIEAFLEFEAGESNPKADKD